MDIQLSQHRLLKSLFFPIEQTWYFCQKSINCKCALPLSCVPLFATLSTVVRQAPLSVGLFRQEYWRGLPCPPPEDLPNPGIESRSPALQADSLPSNLPGKPMNTRVHSLSLLQAIFPTQKSNRGPVYCGWILNQLSYREALDCKYDDLFLGS